MAEERKNAVTRGVVVEFDFTVLDGAQVLFDTAKSVLAAKGVDLTLKLEALHLVGGNYHGGLAELFSKLGKKCDAGAAARELGEAFAKAVDERAAAAVTPEFKAFLKTLADKGIKVVVATRANVETLAPAFAEFDPEKVVLYAEPSMTYGNCKWDAWRRAYSQNGLVDVLTVAVAGSGAGVKSALVAGMGVIAVVHDHVAYQDFGGADVVAEAVDAKLANEVLRMLHA
ncbi:MAG: haloacid dehalogenase-like hydrolase [Kiritimatiellae bacterium]|nr:haloacid dehalogenase-like hydrolase [Kiritimatiellia bacterium]